MSLLDRPERGHLADELEARLHARGSAGGTLVLLLLVAGVLVVGAYWMLRGRPATEPEAPDPVARTAEREDPEAAEAAEDVEADGAGAGESVGAQSVAVWETREGTIHLGDDPPPESHPLGKVTAGDARALAATRPQVSAGSSSGDLQELRRRIREDTRNRPIADDSGLPTWGERDIRGIVTTGDRLDVSTNWITNPVMIRVARGLCRYLSAQGDTYDAPTVVVRGRQSRILARCKAWD